MKEIYKKKERKTLYEKAVSLRMKGFSYKHITKLLDSNVTWPTVRNWVNHIEVDPVIAKRISIENFYENKKYEEIRTRSYRKTFLLKERGHKCEKCSNVCWLENKIPLEIHHINGINEDNRRENILLLCPNCHALTPNYKGKNINSSYKISDKKLIEAVSKSKTIRQILIRIGLTPKGGNYKTIKRRMKKLKIYDKFDRSNAVNKKCLNCDAEVLQHARKFCSRKCSSRYNILHLGKTKIKWPDKRVVESMVKINGFSKTGRELGVSDNAVRKFLKR